MAKEGSPLPEIELQEGNPGNNVKLTDVFKGKKGILFGVPGAFTPGCSKTHLPGYVNDYAKLSEAGAQVIVCVSVNDPFVMEAWGKQTGAEAKGIRMLADTHGKLAKALDLELDMAAALGMNRMKRFSAVIEDNKIKSLNVEPDGKGTTCSLSNAILSQLKA